MNEIEKKSHPTFRAKDIDLICFLRYRGFQPQGNPVEDFSGTRWVLFQETPQLKREVYSFLTGNTESSLLQEFRRTRSFLLDSNSIKEMPNDDPNLSRSPLLGRRGPK